jgi:hypothetical protein
MYAKELQNAWRGALTETTLACVVQEESTIFSQKGAWVFGACDTINWNLLNCVADAVIRLAIEVLERDANEFLRCAGFVVEGDPLHTRYGIHIELPGSDSASRTVFQQALGHFVSGILENADRNSMEMFPGWELADDLKVKVATQIAETLRKQNGKKLKAPLGIVADGLIFGVSGRFAEAPPPEIDRTPFEVVGRIEGIERPDRKLTVLVPGIRERLQRVNFDLDRFLDTFKAILCDGQAYKFTIHLELDARSKTIAVVDSVAPMDEALFVLSS